ncbi:Rmf/CrpP fold protein [Streptomyces sp. NPDC005408]|uniref:Rmf/CrpP fold protein n=1 Tax=Streptomyces sp. NPDC005408 TaxID=3155341 RepID=UPI0033A8021F
MGSREQLVRAVNEGKAAGDAGAPRNSCPYSAEDLRRTAWVQGYNKSRPFPISEET